MGALIAFPRRHARTSAGRKANTAGSGSGLPRSARARDKAKNLSAGIDFRAFQLETAEMPTPQRSAACASPPISSRMASTVSSIHHYCSRCVNKSSAHETAIDCDCGLLFARLMPQATKTIARRLVATRTALGLSAADLCRRIDCKPNRWSQYESGERRITLPVAEALCDEFRLSLDWIYRGDPSALSNQLRIDIKAAMAA